MVKPFLLSLFFNWKILMSNSFSLYAKIIAKGALKWLFMFGLGLLFCLVGIGIGVTVMDASNTPGMPASAHTGMVGAIMDLFYLLVYQPLPTLLIMLSMVVLPITYFLVANKSVVQFAIYEVATKKLASLIIEQITVLGKTIDENPKIQKVTNYVQLKKELLGENSSDKKSSKWQKRIIAFIFNRIDIDPEEFSNGKSVGSILSDKAGTYINEFTEPSGLFTYIVFGGHFILMLLTIIL